ncbi:hypothetical protein H696_04851 [Fonticula alba]|uniref:PX domain-containing protein n=1 Tax=Fonticula alba TaxID=691883 RepID=A0A058Z2Q8_FONAL|nr:hypothetical protein H696_04851 [Fonticula alba]KCV68559.1 hypothetical protein H696_04851 [Fonticula alba]|eukprot:XP_009496991.1 hypothetical protein H696_04851 [Fonticula alba]
MSNEYYLIKIPIYETHIDQSGTTFISYKVEATYKGTINSVFRRFSEFVTLHNEVRKAYKGNHLASNIPVFPPKHPKFMIDHMDDHFVDERKFNLERYMQLLSRLPKIEQVPMYVDFLEGRPLQPSDKK